MHVHGNKARCEGGGEASVAFAEPKSDVTRTRLSPGSVLGPLAFLCCHCGYWVVRCYHCAVLVWSRVLFSVTVSAVSVVELAAMATEVENNVPAGETKEIKEEAPADNKAEEAAAGKQESAGDAPAAKEKEPAPPKVVVHKTNFEKDVVYLYQFSRTPLLPSLSPYCLKVETWLRLAGVKYEVSARKLLSRVNFYEL